MSVEVVASTVLSIETTVYAIIVAIYIMLRQSSELSLTDRLLIRILGPKFFIDDAVEKISKGAFGWVYLHYFTILGYLPGIVFGILGWLTDDMLFVMQSISLFLVAVIIFCYGVTGIREKWMDRIKSEAKEIIENRESRQNVKNED